MGAYEDLFGDEGQKAKAGAAGGGAYDQVFGGAGATGSYDDSPDLDMSNQPMDVPRDPKQEMLAAILDAKKKYGSGTEPIERFAESALSTVSGPFKAAKGLMGVGKSAANEVMTGSMMSALNEIKNGADPKQLLESVLKSGATSGAVDLGLSGLGAIGRGVGKLGEYLGGKARNVVAGGTKKEAEAILDHYDQPEAVDERLGGLLEKYSPSPWYGRSSQGYLKDVQGKLANEGIHYDDVMDRAVGEGVNDAIPGAWKNVQSRAADDAAAMAERPIGKAGRQRAAEYGAVADDVNALPAPGDVRAFGNEKSLVQSDAAPDNIISRSIGDSAADEASGNLGRIYRDELAGVMGNASPRTFDDFTGSRDAYRDLSTLRDLLKSKTAAEQSGGDLGNAISGAILGGGAGLASSALTPGDDSEMLGVGGAVAGLATGTRSALRQAAGSWGADLGANLLKGTGRVARGIGNALDSAPVGSITAAAQNSRGHQSVQVVQRALQQNPAVFGKYASQLQNADDLSTEVSRLMDDEPDFRSIMTQLGGGM